MIDGKLIRGNILAEKLNVYVSKQLMEISHQFDKPKLAVILVGDSKPSHIYVDKKVKLARSLGVNTMICYFPNDITQEQLISKIAKLNQDRSVTAILVQLPLPKHIDSDIIVNSVAVEKDVDGLHITNRGLLSAGYNNALIPCTPLGCLIMLKILCSDNLSGKKVSILGRSNLVGKPMFDLLLQENCTVTLLHSKSKNLSQETSQADIIVSAMGQSRMINQEFVKKDTIIIDVGINQVQSSNTRRLCGDVDLDSLEDKVKYITPVPGGVGPMTVSCLMLNILQLALRQQNIAQNQAIKKLYYQDFLQYYSVNR